ncbi:MAG: nucleoside phosphorylase [Chloroflexi bacterium]|jgi:uridine phosphorylase|nr:nucleoside phosphorylase [Chloroflexota bacterium]MBT3669020.1 nucleoside phosphorylase [Chloroflexota bacterium]MBT4003621.1 nucleoside phosphorylase [Chloroflexota bacterium]MBT4304991.1 nucleoside phosphorylase [Chloroflexota bacterium]MBT4533246.1 nucleoside phosphorylase [Chloroflexota bacterium]
MEAPEVMYHIGMSKGDVGRYVFLPGDPGRCELIASYFDDPKLIAYNREYKTYTGSLLGEKVSVTSTGIGCPSTAIAVEELIMIGADTFVRVGTSGGMQPHFKAGDLGIVTGAIRDEGTTLHYLPAEFPAVADVDVVLALREAAQKLGYSHHLGISHTKDSFFGQHQPERMPVDSRLLNRWKAWVEGGAICSEMEAASIFILSSIYRKRASGIMLIGWNQEGENPEEHVTDLNPLIETAIESVKILIEKDRE